MKPEKAHRLQQRLELFIAQKSQATSAIYKIRLFSSSTLSMDR